MAFEDWLRKHNPEKYKAETKLLKEKLQTKRSDIYLDENITNNNTIPHAVEDTELLRLSYERFANREQAPALIHVKHDVDTERFDSMYAHIDSVEKEFGGKPLWDKREGVENSTIGLRFKGGLDDRDKRDSLQDNLRTVDGLKKAFKTHIKRLK